jgi:hypothetical protein
LYTRLAQILAAFVDELDTEKNHHCKFLAVAQQLRIQFIAAFQ